MLSKKKTVEAHYMGASGKYVKRETAKPRSKSTIVPVYSNFCFISDVAEFTLLLLVDFLAHYI